MAVNLVDPSRLSGRRGPAIFGVVSREPDRFSVRLACNGGCVARTAGSVQMCQEW